MFPRWSPQFHFLNSYRPEWELLDRICFGMIFIKVSLLLSTVSNGSMTEQSSPTSCFSCARFQTPPHPPRHWFCIWCCFLTGLWRSKLPLLKPCLLTTRLWSLCRFMNAWCRLRSEWYPYGNSFIFHVSCYMYWDELFTYNTLRDLSEQQVGC